MTKTQLCASEDCANAAAFRTRTRPSWCDEHITAILRRGGLEPIEPFPGKPTAWRLTRCLACGCEAHYRLEYTIEKNGIGEATCRACNLREWAADVRRLQADYARLTPVSRDEAVTYAERNGYEYLGPLTSPSLPDDPHHVRCIYCGRLSAERLGDIGWGCQCQANGRRDPGARRESQKKRRELFKDSNLRAVEWWDHEKNPVETWETVTPKARRAVWWRCPDCDESFEARVLDIAGMPQCPVCEPRRRAEREAEYERYKNTAIAEVPELLAAWADDDDPREVMVAGWGLRRFRCPKGHHPRIGPLSYLRSGCPHCRGQQTTEERLASLEVDPAAYGLNPEIAAQWHPTKNGKLDKATISPGSRRMVWWRSECCGHEWRATPAEREKRQRLRCPACRAILDSLAHHFPVLAEQWSPSNPTTPWHVRPSAGLAFVPQWVCPDDPSHVWQASLASRTGGAGCPMCKAAGKSAVELEVLEAARARFGNAVSGLPMRDPAFTTRSVWHPDVTVELPGGQRLVIEYDGAYWHADKADVDTGKSLDLLAAGHIVVRLREDDLPPLDIEHPAYQEIRVYSAAPRPHETVAKIDEWVRQREPGDRRAR